MEMLNFINKINLLDVKQPSRQIVCTCFERQHGWPADKSRLSSRSQCLDHVGNASSLQGSPRV